MVWVKAAMRHFLLEGEHLVPFEQRAPELIAAHRRFLQQGYDDGRFLLSGPSIPRRLAAFLSRVLNRWMNSRNGWRTNHTAKRKSCVLSKLPSLMPCSISRRYVNGSVNDPPQFRGLTASLLRQRNELDLVARHLVEMSGGPFGLGLFDAFLA